jgi:hypothetical protein
MLRLRTFRNRSDLAWVLGTVVFLAAMALLLGNIVAGQDIEGARGVVLTVVIILASLIVFHMITRDESDGQFLFRLLMTSLVLKLGAVAFRLWLIFDQYGGTADAVGYHGWGARMAAAVFAGGLGEELSGSQGTQMVRVLTAIFYYVTGPTLLGSFVVWAWLGLLGMLFFYRAFVTAVPNGNRRLFAYLIFLYPSMILWTSSLGKDALVCFGLGMLTYGAARLSRGIDVKGLALAGFGMLTVLLIRPHIAAIAGVAIATGALMQPVRAGMLTPVLKAGGVLIFGALAALVVTTSASYINLEDLSAEGVTSFIEVRQEQTARGGAMIERGGVPSNPLTFLDGVVTVLFRPYMWEARNMVAGIAAIEGVFLMILLVWRRKSVVAAWRATPRSTFLVGAMAYALIFAFFFSAISNFGIIARQRHQLLPFLFVWLAFLPAIRAPRPEDS